MHTFLHTNRLSTWCLFPAGKVLLLLTLYCSVFSAPIVAQDMQFSQQFASAAYLNPALTSLSPHVNVSSAYRSQWISTGMVHHTQQVNANLPFGTKNRPVHLGSLGLTMYNDWAGPGTIRTTGALATLAYNLSLSTDGNHALAFGLQGGMIQKNINFSEGWGSQFVQQRGYDPGIPVAHGQLNSNKLFPTVGAGLMWRHNNTGHTYNKRLSSHVGIAVSHINQPNEAMHEQATSYLPRLYKASAAYELRLGDRLGLMPTVISMYQQKQVQHNGGLFIHLQLSDPAANSSAETEISLGTMYRYQDSYVFSTAIHSRYFSCGFSYDLNQRSLRYQTVGRGAYEISLALQLAKGVKAVTPGAPRLQL